MCAFLSFLFVPLHPSVCVRVAIQLPSILSLSFDFFPALPFTTFFPVFLFAFPLLPRYPLPFLLPFPFTSLIDTIFGRRHSNCTIFLTIPPIFLEIVCVLFMCFLGRVRKHHSMCFFDLLYLQWIKFWGMTPAF